LPTHAAVISIDDDGDAELGINVSGEWGDAGFEFSQTALLSRLRKGDQAFQISPVFSSPRFKIHKLLPGNDRTLQKDWKDPEPGDSDSYFIKVLQRNGHMAWSSPIWCRKES
jgi:hypothetical protein